MTDPKRTFSSEERVLVSACLVGVRCRFDGASKPCEGVLRSLAGVPFVPVCPEQLGGLCTPRPRHERREGKVISEHGVDRTEQFERGCVEALRVMKLSGAARAVLKARSPSCGRDWIYDGTFSGRLVRGHGVFVEKLLAEGYRVMTEEDLGP